VGEEGGGPGWKSEEKNVGGRKKPTMLPIPMNIKKGVSRVHLHNSFRKKRISVARGEGLYGDQVAPTILIERTRRQRINPFVS